MKTPKEKAQELFTNFRFVLSLPDAPLGENKDVIAKQCALICVDEMYDIAVQNDSVIQMNYLVDVKKELESL